MQNLKCIFHDMVTENAELQQQLQSKTQQLMRKEAELTRAEETIRREQQQIQDMVIECNDRDVLGYCNTSLFTGRDYQKRAAVSAGQGQGASSGTAATETAG